MLFDAAERILLRHGPHALTSRAVTTEAGCAKGVLHKHFADFDAFLAEFVLDRVDRMDAQAAALREAWPAGVPVLTEAAIMIKDYLAAERDLGRIAGDAEVDALAPTLIGAGHL